MAITNSSDITAHTATSSAAVDIALGETIPPLTPHAVSVSLPTWSTNVGYEEGEDWVLSKMKTGYPRFFINKIIAAFAKAITERYGMPGESSMLFPTHATASRCVDFFRRQVPHLGPQQVRIVDLVPNPQTARREDVTRVSPAISAVFFPKENFPTAKTFWQHSGTGVSSRRAEYCHKLFDEGCLVDKETAQITERMCKGPRRYQKRLSIDRTNAATLTNGHNGVKDEVNGAGDGLDFDRYIEERFGRNLELAFSTSAKLAIRKRIAGSLTSDVDLHEALKTEKDEHNIRPVPGFSEEDVYLYPTGMSAIYNTHRSLMVAKGNSLKSIEFGFPYIDTLKVLEKFGPGALFYGFGESHELDDLEKRLESGERYMALFCECPGNPLLKTPDLKRIRTLADKYDFAIVVDETIGNFLNVHVLPYADVLVSSLTKLYSGDSNVMGGSAILNPSGRYYHHLKKVWQVEYEDNYWPEDAIFLERNSRDFMARNARINANAVAISDVLRAHPRIKQVNYPKYSPTKHLYEQVRTQNGGYGGLLSATFYSMEDAKAFYDHLDTAKGPSLGTNFTLSSPFVILAHYTELDWAASFGAEPSLIRFSVGLEDTDALVAVFQRALETISDRGGAQNMG